MIVPANPGHWVEYLKPGGNRDDLDGWSADFLQPIIAWDISDEGRVLAITPHLGHVEQDERTRFFYYLPPTEVEQVDPS